MALLFESVRNATPIPSSAKATGNQNKRLARGLSTRATDKRIRRNYRGRAYSGRKTADHSAAGDVLQSHEIIPSAKKPDNTIWERPPQKKKKRQQKCLCHTIRKNVGI